ncbi:MAG: glycosyltransferase, partial [Kiloniellales bacterium]
MTGGAVGGRPRVTAVIICWNAGAALARLLDDLAAPQAGAGLDLDILMVDGGSSDGSVDVARRYGVP